MLGQTLQHLGHCQPLHQEVRDHNRLNPLLSSLWAGDFNWDVNRDSGFSHQLRDFIIRIGLVSVWETHPVSHTHIHTNMQSMSTLDHFMVDPALLPAIIDAGALHLGCNLSRHSPIMIKLDIGNLPTRSVHSPSKPKRPAWYKAEAAHKETFSKAVSSMQTQTNQLLYFRHLLLAELYGPFQLASPQHHRIAGAGAHFIGINTKMFNRI